MLFRSQDPVKLLQRYNGRWALMHLKDMRKGTPTGLLTGSSPVTAHNLAFTKDALGLVVRRLPQPLPGTGAIAEYAEAGNFGVRVVMSYVPNTLAQQFTVDVLYGAAVLRNSQGVQVNN